MEAFKSLDGMEWTSIMTTITKARTINIPYKLLQNHEFQLLNRVQENKSHTP